MRGSPRGVDASSGLEHGDTALRVPQLGALGEVTATAAAIGDQLEFLVAGVVP